MHPLPHLHTNEMAALVRLVRSLHTSGLSILGYLEYDTI